MILSIIVFLIIIYGLIKKVNIYNKFVEGAKDSFSLILSLFPSLLGMIFCINIFVKSGLIEYALNAIRLSFIPYDVLTLMIMRPISSSASLALLSNILSNYGPDSFFGILSSVLQGSTDTTIYILTLYFGSVGIVNHRYGLINGLLADLCAYIISIIIVNLFF